MGKNLLVLLISYLVGSLPTALIVSRLVAHVDIREIGDGNMGARNVTHTLGWGPGIVVAVIDFSKGGLAVLLTRQLGYSLSLQLASGVSAVLGHDFPIYARFPRRPGDGLYPGDAGGADAGPNVLRADPVRGRLSSLA